MPSSPEMVLTETASKPSLANRCSAVIKIFSFVSLINTPPMVNDRLHYSKRSFSYQVLFYVRSNYTEQDFLFKKISLNKIISQVAIKNIDDLRLNKVNLENGY